MNHQPEESLVHILCVLKLYLITELTVRKQLELLNQCFGADPLRQAE